MKHLLAAATCLVTLSVSAQFPYNPDSNGDQLIGAEDLLTFLSWFGGGFSLPTPPVTPVFSQNVGYLQQCVDWDWPEPDTCFIQDFVTDVQLNNFPQEAVLLISDERYFSGVDLKIWSEQGGPLEYKLVVHHNWPEWDQFEEINLEGFQGKSVHYYLSGQNGLYRVR